jgi:hypothetical protein
MIVKTAVDIFYRTTRLFSALMKLCLILCITEDALIRKVPVVSQSCTMSEEFLLDSCSETCVTSPNSAHEVININVDEGINVNTYEQLIPMPISFPPIMAEQVEVSYMSLHPFLDTFLQYPEVQAVLCCLPLSVCPTSTLWHLGRLCSNNLHSLYVCHFVTGMSVVSRLLLITCDSEY